MEVRLASTFGEGNTMTVALKLLAYMGDVIRLKALKPLFARSQT